LQSNKIEKELTGLKEKGVQKRKRVWKHFSNTILIQTISKFATIIVLVKIRK
jgi:hypothetical protein